MVSLSEQNNGWGTTKDLRQSNNTSKMFQYRWLEKGTAFRTLDSTSEKHENAVLTPVEKKKEPPDF